MFLFIGLYQYCYYLIDCLSILLMEIYYYINLYIFSLISALDDKEKKHGRLMSCTPKIYLEN